MHSAPNKITAIIAPLMVSIALLATLITPPGLATRAQDDATPAPLDVDALSVPAAVTLDLLAGALNRSAHLAPDGDRFLYNDGRALCVYSLLGIEADCTAYEDVDGLRAIDSDSLYWSPDGAWVTFTTAGLVYAEDTDIWALNVEAGELTNITDDGTLNFGFRTDEPVGDMDLSPRWLPDGRIVFLRYTRAADIVSAPNIMAIAPEGGEAETLGVLPHGNEAYLVINFAPSADGASLSYAVEFRDDRNAGVWISALNGEDARRVVVLNEETAARIYPWNGEVSPDGRYALALGVSPNFASETEPELSPMRFADLSETAPTGELIDPDRYVIHAGWSPTGSALAYIVRDLEDEASSGLYLTATPGEPGRQILPGDFFVPTSAQRQPIIWSANNTILLSDRATQQLVVVRLE